MELEDYSYHKWNYCDWIQNIFGWMPFSWVNYFHLYSLNFKKYVWITYKWIIRIESLIIHAINIFNILKMYYEYICIIIK